MRWSNMPRTSVLGVVVVLCLGGQVESQEETKFKCPITSNYFYPCTCEGGGENGIYVRCENSNLASIAVGLANVRFPIEELRLYKCNFKKLYGDIFKPLLLLRLVIEDTPISEVDKDVLAPVGNTLLGLHFFRAPLQSIPTEALGHLRKLEDLEIDQANLTRLENGALPPLPKLRTLTLTNCGLEAVGRTALQGMNKLVKVFLAHNNLKSLPNGLFRGKRTIRLLDLGFNKFNNLDPNYFQDLNQMTWCNMTHNSIKEFGKRNPFARNSVLGWLSLSHNNLTKLDTRDFRSMRVMRRLFLNDNQIKSIGRGAFQSMKRIGTIDLARNRLDQVAAKVFENLGECEKIDISENQITELHPRGFANLFLVHINASHNQISTFHTNAFFNCHNMLVLDLSHNNISKIPKETFGGDRCYMADFRLQFNNISSLGDIPMTFSGIKVLNISYNNISVIPRNSFPELYELHTIDMSHNNLKIISEGVFNKLFSIRSMNFSHNSLQVIKRSTTFGSLPTLLWLDMSHNMLREITRVLFVDLVSLRELYIGHNAMRRVFQLPQSLNYLHMQNNNLSRIGRNSWPVMNALLYLDLDNNNLGDTMKSGTFQHLNSLRTLRLTNNSITTPPWQALGEMQTLQYLYLDHNNITNLTRGAFGRLPVVFHLSLTHNGLANISKQSFEGMLQLITLNLSHNELHFIPNEAFRGCVSMQTIDLSHNYLKKIDNDTNGLLDDLLSVRNINVSHNQFGTVSKKMFPYHRYIPYNVENVDMSYNRMPVLHKNLLIGLQKVKKLNISHNILNEIRPSVIGNLTQLEVIDLSYNELEALSNSVFGRGKSLREVHLQNNQLISMPAPVLMSNQNLTYLDLSNNNLRYYYEDFVPRVVNGTTVKYQNNPVECDCSLRRVRAWLDTWLGSESWQDVVCQLPLHLANRSLPMIAEEELRCNDLRRANDSYQVNPDVRFRLLGENPDLQEKLAVSWYVTTREDVGGFSVGVYNATTGLEVARNPANYTDRTASFPAIPRGRYRVCLGVLDSLKEVRPLQPAQCHSFFVSAATSPAPSLILFTSLLLLQFAFSCCR